MLLRLLVILALLLTGRTVSADVDLTPSQQAWLDAHPVVRVGAETDWPPFDFVENDTAVGFANDYLRLLGEKLGIELQFEHGHTWPELMAGFQAHEIDILPAIWFTEERRAFTAFTRPYYEHGTAIVVRTETTDIDSLDDLAGRRVAVTTGFAITDQLRAALPSFEAVEVSDTLEGLLAVHGDRADAYVDGLATINYLRRKHLLEGLSIAGMADPEAFGGSQALHIGVRGDWAELTGILEQAMTAVTPAELSELRHRWIDAPTQTGAVPLTDDEREWLAKHRGTLRIAVPDILSAPLTIVEPDGNVGGVAPELLRLAAERAGIALEFVQVRAGAAAASLDSEQANVTLIGDGDDLDHLTPGAPLITQEWAAVYRIDTDPPVRFSDLNGLRIAIVAGEPSKHLIATLQPLCTIIAEPNTLAAAMLVAGGQADMYLALRSPAEHTIQRYGLERLDATPLAWLEPWRLRLATRGDDAPLRQLLDKAVTTITPTERALVAARWSAPARHGGEWERAATIAMSALCVVFAILAFVVVVNRRLAREVSSRRMAEEAAAAANVAKSEFLANMSHELRTPMTAILGYADLLLDNEASEVERAERITTITRNGRHLLAIINDILDVSKIEAGKMMIERVETSPVGVVEEVTTLMRGRAAGKGLELRVAYATPMPVSIQSDPTRLRQILTNLVGNAIKFTEIGRVTVRCECATDERGRCRVRFDVIDTGIGMTPEQCELIAPCEAFTQADASTTRKSGGSGLGLRISNSLAEMLGGSLAIESEHGRGSTFSVTIDGGDVAGLEMTFADAMPVGADGVRRPVAPVAAGPVSAEPVSAPSRPLEGERVLLAEDGPDNQRLISFHLRRAGADVTLAKNGVAAIERVIEAEAAGAPFTIVLMDMQMPELDGYAATRALRTSGIGLAIVALTAHAMEGDREKCLAAGCSDYLSKPIDPVELIRTCARWTQSADEQLGAPAPAGRPTMGG